MKKQNIFIFSSVFFCILLSILFLNRSNIKPCVSKALDVIVTGARYSKYEVNDKETIERLQALSLQNMWTLDFSYNIQGKSYVFRDLAFSKTTQMVAKKLDAEYSDIKNIKFLKGDNVIDVGANVGMVSCVLAKNNPEINVFAFEPADFMYKSLKYNIDKNETSNVNAFNYGLGARSEKLAFKVSAVNSGGSSAFFYQNLDSNLFIDQEIQVHSFNKVMDDLGLKAIKLLKIDCEGCEFDFFEAATDENLAKIEYVVAESHCLSKTDEERWNKILARLYKFIKKENILYTSPHPDFCQQKK